MESVSSVSAELKELRLRVKSLEEVSVNEPSWVFPTEDSNEDLFEEVFDQVAITRATQATPSDGDKNEGDMMKDVGEEDISSTITDPGPIWDDEPKWDPEPNWADEETIQLLEPPAAYDSDDDQEKEKQSATYGVVPFLDTKEKIVIQPSTVEIFDCLFYFDNPSCKSYFQLEVSEDWTGGTITDFYMANVTRRETTDAVDQDHSKAILEKFFDNALTVNGGYFGDIYVLTATSVKDLENIVDNANYA